MTPGTGYRRCAAKLGTYYAAINRNKRSIALDLADDADLATAHELSARADVMIENFRPGALRRFGLDYESVAARNPTVIYSSISGFGAGQGAALPGYDLLVQAVSGLMSLTGSPDGPPYRAGISAFDVMTGLHSAMGILAALHYRDNTGTGQHIEASLLASALSAMVNQTSAYVAGNVVPHRMGNSHPSLFPYEPLPTADGEIIVIAGNDRQFRKLAAALGIAEVAEDPAVRDRAPAERQPRAAAPTVDRLPGDQVGAGVVRCAQCGGHSVRSDQRRSRRHRTRNRTGTRTSRIGRGGADRQAPAPVLPDPASL